MIDTSIDSEGVHSLVSARVESLLTAIVTGDADMDGVSELAPVTDVQVGVINADLGAGTAFPGCDRTGDEGHLQTEGTGGAGCLTEYPTYQVVSDLASARTAANALKCVAFSRDGCGVEQLLGAFDAAIEARTGQNHGFFREDAALAVVFVSKEDDCSVADPALFDSEGEYASTPIDTRCIAHPEALSPPAEHADRLLAFEASSRLTVMVLAGVPVELDGMPPSALIAQPAMEPMLDPSGPSGMRASCSDDRIGAAFPPARLIDFASRLEAAGARAIAGSVCAADPSARFRDFAASISASAYSVCD